MDGLLLRLLEDSRGQPGRWFWPCFEPIRADLERYWWVHASAPWMGSPLGFLEDDATVDFEERIQSDIQLWRPGALGRWAKMFCEESINLWAVDPTHDPKQEASEFSNAGWDHRDAFIENRAIFWLLYTDSCCWEIFARDQSFLTSVSDSLKGSSAIRVVQTSSQDRRRTS